MNTLPVDPLKTRLWKDFKHTRPLVGCRFDPTGRYLFASSEDDSIQRFDLVTGEKSPLIGHQSWVRGLTFVMSQPRPHSLNVLQAAGLVSGGMVSPKPVPFTLVTGDYHGKMLWWNGAEASPKPVRTIQAHDGWVRAVAVNHDGRMIATCGNDRLVKLWSSVDGKLLNTFVGHDSHVYNVAFHPAGQRLISADLKGTIHDWEIASGKSIRLLDAKVLHKYDTGFGADIGGIRGISFNQSGSQLACIGITNVSNAFAGVGNPLVVTFDWAEGKPKQLKPKDAFQATGWGVQYHPNGTVIGAGGGGQGRIWFWNAADGVNTHTVTVPTNARDMHLHPDGQLIALAGASGGCLVYTMSPEGIPSTMPKK